MKVKASDKLNEVLNVGSVRKSLVEKAILSTMSGTLCSINNFHLARDGRKGRSYLRVLQEHGIVNNNGKLNQERLPFLLDLEHADDLLSGGSEKIIVAEDGKPFIKWESLSLGQQVFVAKHFEEFQFFTRHRSDNSVVGKDTWVLKPIENTSDLAYDVWNLVISWESIREEGERLVLAERSAKPISILNHFHLLDDPTQPPNASGEPFSILPRECVLPAQVDGFDDALQAKIDEVRDQIRELQIQVDGYARVQSICRTTGGIKHLQDEYKKAFNL